MSGGDGNAEKRYVDLEERYGSSKTISSAGIKVVEVMSEGDLPILIDMLNKGNILVLDFSRFTDGYETKKGMSEKLSRTAMEMNGVFAEISDRLTVISTRGLPVDKCKIMHKGGQ